MRRITLGYCDYFVERRMGFSDIYEVKFLANGEMKHICYATIDLVEELLHGYLEIRLDEVF